MEIPSRQFDIGADTFSAPLKFPRTPFTLVLLPLTQLPHALPALLPTPAQTLLLGY